MDWSAIIQGVAGIWMAFIATCALNSWKRKIKTQKHIDFIDELIETIHAFILSMSAPVSFLKFAKIGIDSYAGIHGESEEIKNPEAVAFIRKRGKSTKEDTQECLNAVRSILSRMKSLVAKGQVFGIENYSKCQNACSMLEWSYNQTEAFFLIIGNPNLNWNNPDVERLLDKVLSFDPVRIKSNLTKQSSEFLLFATRAYEKALK